MVKDSGSPSLLEEVDADKCCVPGLATLSPARVAKDVGGQQDDLKHRSASSSLLCTSMKKLRVLDALVGISYREEKSLHR